MKSKEAKKFFKEQKGAVYSEAKKFQTYAYEYMSLSSLPDGTYYFHLMPKHPEKCPAGETYVATARFPDADPSAPEWKRQDILLGECTGEPCWITELTQALNKQDRLKRLPSIIKARVVKAISPFKQMWYPTAWLLDIKNEEVKAPTLDNPEATKNKKTYTSNPSRKMEQGILLKVWQKTVVEDIDSSIEEFPEVRDPVDGRCLKLVKKGKKYKVTVSKKRAVKNKNLYKSQYKDINADLERITFSYEDQKILFAERLGSEVIKALRKVGINLESPLKEGSGKSAKALEEDYDEDEEDFEEVDMSDEEDEEDEDFEDGEEIEDEDEEEDFEDDEDDEDWED